MATGTAISSKTESVLNRLNPSAINPNQNTTTGTRQTEHLSKHQLGGYFANMDRAGFLLLMMWNHSAQPKDIQEFKHHLIIDVISTMAWFSEIDYIQNPKFRNQVNALVEIAVVHILKSKRLTKIKQAEMIGISKSNYYQKWEPRVIELETYLHQLLNKSAQQVHRNI